ncbi:MAG: homocysteine S-methyltransferase family protein [SAR324 cluster bacterium]|nr:homocysteine S-methyltransferase family protein [SAR324 cluster bacterium]
MNFLEALKQQVIVLDGAMGTMIQNLELGHDAFGGAAFGMLSDMLSFSHPDAIQKIHLAYFRSGAHAVETNTFGATPLRLQEYDFSQLDTSAFAPIPHGFDLNRISYEEMAYAMSRVGAEIAVRAKAVYQKEADYDGRPLFVIGSIGPSNTVLSSTSANLRKGTWAQVESNFYHQVLGLIDGGADVLLYETQQDILEVKAAVAGGLRAMSEKKIRLPIMVQVTVDQFCKMQIFNTDIHAALTTVQGIGIDVFGINCSIGPDLMRPTVEKLSRYSKLPISVIPNAGLPTSENGKTVYRQTPQDLARHLSQFVNELGINIVGGCCGTTPAYIKAISDAVRGITPVSRKLDSRVYLSGPQQAVAVDSTSNLIRIGERLNVRGSKKVKDAVENPAGVINFDELEEVVNEQVKDLGVDIIDVCMDSNVVSTPEVLPKVIQAMTLDFSGAMCLDSFDVDALKNAIQVYPGRPIVNSISLEEYAPGLSKIDALVPETKFHHPLYIALATDLEGPALTADKKVELATKIMEACAVHGVTPDQLLIDVNAFPIGAESIEGMNFSMESLNSIPRIKALHPDIKTTIGVGNLTNGLAKKPYMRLVLTSIFLDEGRKRGLDAAIVNPNHYVPVESIDPKDYELGLKIVLERDMDAFARLEEIAEIKKGGTVAKKQTYEDLPDTIAICEKIKDGFKERIGGSVTVEGFTYEYQDKIVEQAARVIQHMQPLDLINQHLMKAMQELGDRFGAGEVSLPHLLKSADVMKHVMGFLESFMKRNTVGDGGISYKGTIVLGTVYQDVHSIGKDLAKTLFENYGYRVIDLGVQVPLEKFIETAREHQADAIGMSALLVQTSNHMITVSRMVQEAGFSIPLLIGGAPVNRRHAGYVAMAGQEDLKAIKPDVFYCASAMDGVNIIKALQSAEKEQFIEKNREELKTYYERARKQSEKTESLLNTLPRRTVAFDKYQAPPVKYGVTAWQLPLSKLPLDEKTLYALNWRLGRRDSWEKKGLTPESVDAMKRKWITLCEAKQWLVPQGHIGLFPCQSDGDEVLVYAPEDLTQEIARIDFTVVLGKGNQDKFSAAQFYHPVSSGKYDVIGFQISTGGNLAEQQIETFKAEGDTESAMLLQGLSDRVAEDMAEWLHEKLRELTSTVQRTGARYSPGYPGITNLQNNRTLYQLIQADKLGIRLTDAHEFIPTGTTGAVVCFHPEADYS